MLQNILKPNDAIEETARTTPAHSFWGYTWRFILVTLVAVIPALALYLAICFLFSMYGNIAVVHAALGVRVPVAVGNAIP